MQAINAIQHMKMFDVVMSHAYTLLKKERFTNGLKIPQDEFKAFERARNYALYLNKLNLLGEMYERIMKGLD